MKTTIKTINAENFVEEFLKNPRVQAEEYKINFLDICNEGFEDEERTTVEKYEISYIEQFTSDLDGITYFDIVLNHSDHFSFTTKEFIVTLNANTNINTWSFSYHGVAQDCEYDKTLNNLFVWTKGKITTTDKLEADYIIEFCKKYDIEIDVTEKENEIIIELSYKGEIE